MCQKGQDFFFFFPSTYSDCCLPPEECVHPLNRCALLSVIHRQQPQRQVSNNTFSAPLSTFPPLDNLFFHLPVVSNLSSQLPSSWSTNALFESHILLYVDVGWRFTETPNVPRQLVFPPVDDTVAALPARETLPFPGAPVRTTSSGLTGGEKGT